MSGPFFFVFFGFWESLVKGVRMFKMGDACRRGGVQALQASSVVICVRPFLGFAPGAFEVEKKVDQICHLQSHGFRDLSL